ncbi:protein spire homolog 1-like [Indicator indicator]|uniref:protein spire homolog 1-like n=1 Tax=Indicator indicator TaxID=1002788 RepID=UPI0023DFC45C|nr:protein spire homolog 1-like [Indicator indicator]
MLADRGLDWTKSPWREDRVGTVAVGELEVGGADFALPAVLSVCYAFTASPHSVLSGPSLGAQLGVLAAVFAAGGSGKAPVWGPATTVSRPIPGAKSGGEKTVKMEAPHCEQRITKVSLAEILRCFEQPISEEQAWAICFQCCCKMEQLAQGLSPSLHSVFIKGSGSIFLHADGTASFKVYRKSDVGNSIQQSEDKLLEYLGVVIYEALDWGIDNNLERELSDPLEKLLCLMLKLDEKAMKPADTLQDVIKACEEHLSRPSEASSHYEMTCRSLFTEYMELQKLQTIIQRSKEHLRRMDMEDLVKNPLQKNKKYGVTPQSSIIRELQKGVKLRKSTERPRRCAPPQKCVRSPYELLLDDIQHKRYTLRKVIIKPDCRTPKADLASPKPHLKPVGDLVLKETAWESSCHEQLMAEIKQPQELWSAAAKENGSRPSEMLVTPNIALKSPSKSLTLQDANTVFKTVATTQQLGPGVQETTPKLHSSTWLASDGSSVVSCKCSSLAANCTSLTIKPNAGQQQLPLHKGRSKSLERDLQSKDLDHPFPTKWLSPTIAELIGTRYSMIVLEGQGFPQGGSDGVFPRAKICFSCYKQMFLKWPYSCYLCSSVVCCDCCIKASVLFTTAYSVAARAPSEDGLRAHEARRHARCLRGALPTGPGWPEVEAPPARASGSRRFQRLARDLGPQPRGSQASPSRSGRGQLRAARPGLETRLRSPEQAAGWLRGEQVESVR